MKYAELRAPDFVRMDKADKVVIVPLGSVEQHGQHMPMVTDSLIGGTLAERVEAALPDRVLLTPMLWLGSSDHHLSSPGTLSLPSSLYIDVVANLCECILAAGFRRIFLLISHGGNEVPCQEVIYRISMKHRDRFDFWLASGGWWSVGEEGLKQPEMESPRVTHACEYETSMVLAVRSDLVDMSAAEGQHPFVESKFYFPTLTTLQRSKVNVSLPFEFMTGTGAMGRPELATAEKGHKLLDAVSAEITRFVEEFARWPRPTLRSEKTQAGV